MQTIQLQVEDEFVAELMGMLPSDKVVVLKENYNKNREILHKALQEYRDNKADFIPYFDSMTQLDSWIQEEMK